MPVSPVSLRKKVAKKVPVAAAEPISLRKATSVRVKKVQPAAAADSKPKTSTTVRNKQAPAVKKVAPAAVKRTVKKPVSTPVPQKTAVSTNIEKADKDDDTISTEEPNPDNIEACSTKPLTYEQIEQDEEDEDGEDLESEKLCGRGVAEDAAASALAAIEDALLSSSDDNDYPECPPAQLESADMPWCVTESEFRMYSELFRKADKDCDNMVNGKDVMKIFMSSKLPVEVLGQIWTLIDVLETGSINVEQFSLAMHLITKVVKGDEVPTALSPAMVPPSFRCGGKGEAISVAGSEDATVAATRNSIENLTHCTDGYLSSSDDDDYPDCPPARPERPPAPSVAPVVPARRPMRNIAPSLPPRGGGASRFASEISSRLAAPLDSDTFDTSNPFFGSVTTPTGTPTPRIDPAPIVIGNHSTTTTSSLSPKHELPIDEKIVTDNRNNINTDGTPAKRGLPMGAIFGSDSSEDESKYTNTIENTSSVDIDSSTPITAKSDMEELQVIRAGAKMAAEMFSLETGSHNEPASKPQSALYSKAEDETEVSSESEPEVEMTAVELAELEAIRAAANQAGEIFSKQTGASGAALSSTSHENEVGRKRDEAFRHRERNKRARDLDAQDLFSARKTDRSELASEVAAITEKLLSSGTIASSSSETEEVIREYKQLEISTLVPTVEHGAADAKVVSKIISDMERLERQLMLLPDLFICAAKECSKHDSRELQGVAARVREIRNAYLLALFDGNRRLDAFGINRRPLERVEGLAPYRVAATVTGYRASSFTSQVPGLRPGSTVASRLTVGTGDHIFADADDNGEEEEDYGNFSILASTGLMSKRGMKDVDADGVGLYDDDEFGGNAEMTTEEVDYLDIKDLLKELNDDVTDTCVVVSNMLAWDTPDRKTGCFSDFQIELITDESAFAKNRSTVRRSYIDFVWLKQAIEEELELDSPEELPGQAPMPTSDPLDDEIALADYLDELGSYLTAIAEHPDYQTAACVQRFLTDDVNPLPLLIERPGKFTTSMIESGEFDRAFVIALPVYHLKAVASFYNIDVTLCVTRFEYADKILVELSPETAAAERIEVYDLNASAGESFDAKRSQTPTSVPLSQEDSSPSHPENTQNEAAKLALFVKFTETASKGVVLGPQDATTRLPVSVSLFLKLLSLGHHLKLFTSAGYDDLRVVAAMQPYELDNLGVPKSDWSLVTKAGFEWTVKARECGLLDNWEREIHRAGASGVHVVASAAASDLDLATSSIADGASNTNPFGEPQLSSDGTYFVGADGNMDLKIGDEEVKMGWGDTSDWDPAPILKVLYDSPRPIEDGDNKQENDVDDVDDGQLVNSEPVPVSVEGFLDKLPRGSNMKSIIKRWNRKYLKARDGELFYYSDNKPGSEAQGCLRLRGSEIKYGVGNTLEVIDSKSGRHLILRASSTTELEHWKNTLDTETASGRLDSLSTMQHSPSHERKISRVESIQERSHTLIFDIGGASVRAGFAGSRKDVATAWPDVFFPAVVSANMLDGTRNVGSAAVSPSGRRNSKVFWPLRAVDTMDQDYAIDELEYIYNEVYSTLGVDPTDFNALLSEPQMMSDKDRISLAELMFETYGVPSLYIRPQSLLAMYSYGATTGVIVDVGERLDVVPVESGYVFEQGITRLRHGGRQVTEQMQRMMSEEGHRFFSEVESYIGRLVKERVGFVAPDYREACDAFESGRLKEEVVDCRRFGVPDGTKQFKVKAPRFTAPEGLFDPNLWGSDTPGLPELVRKAIMSAPIDLRKPLARNVYLAGGTTLLPGIAERLESATQALVPQGMIVKVHPGEHREHAAYRGGCVVAGLNNFESMCVSQDDWNEVGTDILKKFSADLAHTRADDLEFSSDEQ